ncbi:MAG: CBS domain-containing protein [Candidatus Saccharibacteria bacterium]
MMYFQIVLLATSFILSLCVILLVRSFEYMSISELKRQSRSGNPDAKKVYPVRVYGVQLWIVLWATAGFLISSMILLLHSLIGPYWTLLISVPIIVVFHAILPWTKRPKPSLHLAALASPFIERLLRILYPVLKWSEKAIGHWIQPEPLLLIQSKDELLEILHHNAEEFDNVSHDELVIAEHALVFGDKLIGDYMTPLGVVKFISVEEMLTPVVLGELHDSGHSRFPIYQGNNQNIIGTLFLRDALKIKGNKTARDIMRVDVFYINELQTLDHALQAFIKTKHHLFVVVNEFEDVVGVLSISDVVKQILGHQISDEFDKFDDLREVAKQTAIQKRQIHADEHV